MYQRSFACATLLVVAMLFAADVTLADDANTLTPEQAAEGWLLLYDGETDFGWKTIGETPWSVEDGVLASDDGKPGLMLTTSQFGDYELKADFKLAEGTVAAVLLRTSPTPAPYESKCYGVRLDATKASEMTGQLLSRKANDAKPEIKPGEWHTLDVTADGARITVKIDGETVNEYEDAKPLGRGFIGLATWMGKAEFRNVMLKPINETALFNGENLDGWNTFPDLPTEVSVTEDGVMQLTNGSGMVETAKSYADFTFQTDVFIAVDGINSGVFFRCIPGDKMNGYEAQLNNTMLDDDPTKPADCGTGGIFRRADARKIIAKDKEWFTVTVHADDKHIMTWVNGYPVCDWTDTREPDENPRRGLRLEPGTIQFQGHDPTTDVRFRNIRISEIPER